MKFKLSNARSERQKKVRFFSAPAFTQIAATVLKKGALLRFRAEGFSMSPVIKSGDVITLSPLGKNSLQLGNIVAFRHPDTDRLLIHRIVGKRKHRYLTKGDACVTTDGWISKTEILGCVNRMERSHRTFRFGLGPERYLIALLSQTNLLPLCLRGAHLLFYRIRGVGKV